MRIQDLVAWAAFAVPLVLVGMTGFIRKVVDKKDFCSEHWYLGIDLTVYFLAVSLLNGVDIAGEAVPNSQKLIWTLLMIVSGIFVLLFQLGIHQQWAPRNEKSFSQKFMLFFVGNIAGILTLYAFVLLKRRGLL